mgnify:CR=1 FL=1
MNWRPAQLGGLAAVLTGFALVVVDVSPLAILGQYSYVVVLLFGLGAFGTGRILGIDMWLEEQQIVKDNPWLTLFLG